MTSVTPSNVTKASLVFRAAVADQFELEPEFLDTVCELFVKAALPLTESTTVASKKAAAPRDEVVKVRQPRKKSAYNVYVREQMKTDDIKSIDHKSKMAAIAKSWKELSEEDKARYTSLANDENVPVAAPAPADEAAA
jgi:hypothetical protein